MKSEDVLDKHIQAAGNEGLSFYVACRAMEEYYQERSLKEKDALEEAVHILALLVRCKEIKDTPTELKSQADIEFYNKCKPLAWMKAKAFLTL